MATAELLETTVEGEPAPVEQERRVWTALDILERFGPIPMNRLRHNVEYGTATEEDVLRLEGARTKSLCELIDGVLVEKTVGYLEAIIAMTVGRIIGNHVDARGLGVVAGEGGLMRFRLATVCIPDVSFVSKERLPPGGVTREHAIAPFVPTLAVEVLSKSNTRREMEAKLQDYFACGVVAVWVVDPATNSVRLHDGPNTSRTVKSGESFDAGPVLPGLVVEVASIFQVS
jgi:Uma2 family endonuclease